MFSSNTSQVASSAANYVEDVFSAFLYAGSNSGQTLTDGIDRTLGALDWFKVRNLAGENHILWDTARSGGLETNTTASESSVGRDKSTYITQNNGNVVLNFGGNGVFNSSGYNYVKWTFRKQVKFFDVVTYTGNEVVGRTIAHNLGSVPGCILIKSTSQTSNWAVYHRSLGGTQVLRLNSTLDAASIPSPSTYWNDTNPTSTVFTVGDNLAVNTLGATYVAYIFAHNAGGFGLTGSDNVISCGSFTTSGTSPNNATVNLGYEPQFLLYKISNSTGDWRIVDNMRGFLASGASTTSPQLRPNSTSIEQNNSFVQLTSTGFTTDTGVDAQTYIYIAIRRGPMKTPTSGTSVYEGTAFSGNGAANRTIGSSLTADLVMLMDRTANSAGWTSYAQYMFDRLRGEDVSLATSNTNAEVTGWGNTYFNLDQQIGWSNGSNASYTNNSGTNYVSQTFKRAPSFMDVVCYTGTGSATTVTHNLGVTPELIICKSRSSTYDWAVYSAAVGNSYVMYLNTDFSASNFGAGMWNNTSPTSSVFSVGTNNATNGSSITYVAYLFATCAGVSKVGSYTGTGTTKQIDCGFTGGARFVLIKRTDSTGDWYVWDSARGIVAGNDPYLLLNSTAAEVTNTDYIDTYSAGFEISSTAPAAINANGGTFIFLAIA